jgi:hypothetical protein
MIRTTIKHGYLHIEFCEDGAMQLTHEQQGASIRLSPTEWEYLRCVAHIHNWPIAPSNPASASIADALS